MKGKIISHEDFMAVEKLSDEHLKLIKKHSDCKRNKTLCTCAEVMLCIVITAIVIYYVKGLSLFNCIFFSALFLLPLIIGIVELVCTFGRKIRISAAAYGTVTELICAERQVPARYSPEILSWENDKYKKYKKTEVASTLQYYYYINAETSQGFLQHICCYKSDYDCLSVGDKVIIIKYGNDTILCLPAK